MSHLNSPFDPIYSFNTGIGAIFTEVKDNSDFSEIAADDSNIPILPLRGEVVFPFISLPIQVGRESTLKLIDKALRNQEAVFAVKQTDSSVENPGAQDLCKVGVVCKIVKLIELPDKTKTVFLISGNRARLEKVKRKTPFLTGTISPMSESVPDYNDPEMHALIASVFEVYNRILDAFGIDESQELRFAFKQFENPLKQLNFICVHSPLDPKQKQQLLEESDVKARTFMLARMLENAYQLVKLKADIQMRTQEDLTQQQKEHFLHQQIRTIQDELGGSTEDSDLEELRGRASEISWPEYAQKHFEKEIKKLERFNASNPEYSIQYNYLDTLLSLPWKKFSQEDINIGKVTKVLNHDHYGLEKVKDRIIEHVAVMKLRKDMKSPILCLHGSPGVGKTSLGKSIATALGRDYCRVSLGGLHDESEIRGHRRTYIGAMPGRIISAMAKCGTSNPVFVLDEIDKIGNDYKGDPSTALLEVLDPEQNSHFHDNYLDVDYDLSNVFFIATANDLSTISRPLLDRMELVNISGYITAEKIEIARRHLIPRIIEQHGFEKEDISFQKSAIEYLIERYTRESGVRQLEKQIASVVRKTARLKASGLPFDKEITRQKIRELLGAETVNPDVYENNDCTGVVTGLAWTQVGGEILFIESSISKGKGEVLSMTGNLGDVMKESATLAMKYIKANAEKFGIDPKTIAESDVHIHVPEGAIPKDGPSAGITMATSLVSSFTGRKVREKTAMTGEITLRGKILPVGGIKEKILAAKRAGIKDIVLCCQNRKDIEEINEKYLKGLTFHYFDRIEEVISFALLD